MFNSSTIYIYIYINTLLEFCMLWTSSVIGFFLITLGLVRVYFTKHLLDSIVDSVHHVLLILDPFSAPYN